MKRAKAQHIIEGMTEKNIRYAVMNSLGRGYITRINENGARIYNRGVKVAPEHGGSYHIRDSVAEIVKSEGNYRLLPGKKGLGRPLNSFERVLERKCREYNKQHKKVA